MNRKYIFGFIIASVLTLGACSEMESPVTGPSSDPGLAAPLSGQLMVKFTPEVTQVIEENAVATRSGVLTRSSVLSVDQVLEAVGSYELERVFPVDPRTEDATREAGLHQWYIVRFPEEYTAEDVAAALKPLGEVQKTGFVREIKRAYNTERKAVPVPASVLNASAADAGYPFNDPLLAQGLQWDIINRGDLFPGRNGTSSKGVMGADVQVESAWKECTGDQSIVVAVLDEGVFIEHPDLKNSIWVNEDEIFRSHKDNDGNGFAGDRHGYNFVRGTGVISWDNIYDTGHASHVSGVIAAQNNNGIGMSSIAGGTPDSPGVRIMSCQIFDGDLTTNSYTSIQAIKYAADNGAHVLQCSWGYVSGAANVYDWGASGFADQETWEYACPLEKEVLDYFIHRAGSDNGPLKGGIAIFASGNEYAPMAGYPGAAEYCVSVAATAADFTPAVYTNYGPGTTISAPGGDQNYYYEYKDEYYDAVGYPLNYGELGCIVSTLPYHVSESGYGYMEGTSMACPHVSGVVALGLSYAARKGLHFTADQIRELLYASATDIDPYMQGEKEYYRYVADMGINHPQRMSLSDYRGQMGAGQVNAAKFLELIGGSGIPVEFPNLYISLGGSVTVDASLYFTSDDVTVDIADTSIAACSVDEKGRLVFAGLATGMTTASVSDGSATYEIVITVRSKTNDDSWL